MGETRSTSKARKMKLISILLAAVLVLSGINIAAFAESMSNVDTGETTEGSVENATAPEASVEEVTEEEPAVEAVAEVNYETKVYIRGEHATLYIGSDQLRNNAEQTVYNTSDLMFAAIADSGYTLNKVKAYYAENPEAEIKLGEKDGYPLITQEALAAATAGIVIEMAAVQQQAPVADVTTEPSPEADNAEEPVIEDVTDPEIVPEAPEGEAGEEAGEEEAPEATDPEASDPETTDPEAIDPVIVTPEENEETTGTEETPAAEEEFAPEVVEAEEEPAANESNLGAIMLMGGINMRSGGISSSIATKWSTSADAFDEDNFDTVQTAESFLLEVGFPVTTELSKNLKFTINVPQGLQVVSSSAGGSNLLATRTITGSNTAAGGTNITYTVNDGAAGSVAVQIEMKNVSTAGSQPGSNTLYGPGESIPFKVDYSYGETSSPTTAQDTYELKVKPYDLKLGDTSGLHFIGTYHGGNIETNHSVDVCAPDYAWYEEVALKEGKSQTYVVLYDSSETPRSKMSPTADLEIVIPLPEGFAYTGMTYPFYPSGSSYTSAKYEYSYDDASHSVIVKLKKSSWYKTILRNTEIYGYEILIPLGLQYDEAAANKVYAATEPIKYRATDVVGTVHTIDSEKYLTIYTHKRNTTTYSVSSGFTTWKSTNSSAPKAQGNVYVGEDKSTILVRQNLTRAAGLEERPYLYNNASFVYDIPDGYIPQNVLAENLDSRPGHTFFEGTVSYQIEGDSAWHVAGQLNSPGTPNSGNSLNTRSNESLVLPTDVTITKIKLDLTRFGSMAMFWGNYITYFSIYGIADDTFRNGTKIEDGDEKPGKASFTADDGTSQEHNFTTTYYVKQDRLKMYAQPYSGGNYERDTILTMKSDQNIFYVDAFMANPTGAITHNNGVVTMKPINGVKLTGFADIVNIDQVSKVIVYFEGGGSQEITDVSSGYTCESGTYIEKIEYYLAKIESGYGNYGNESPSAYDFYTNNIAYFRLKVWVPPVDDISVFPLDGKIPRNSHTATNILSIDFTSDERTIESEKYATWNGAAVISDTVSLRVGTWFNDTVYRLSTTPSSDTIGSTSPISVSYKFYLTPEGYSSAISQLDEAQRNTIREEYGYIPESFTMYMKMSPEFSIVADSVDASTFGENATVDVRVEENYSGFNDGDNLVVLQFENCSKELIPGLWAQDNFDLKFQVAPKRSATAGVNKVIIGANKIWYALPDEDIGVKLSNKTGGGNIFFEKGKTYSTFNDVDEYDVNENGDNAEVIGRHNNAALTFTLNDRAETGVFGMGASQADPALGTKDYRGWQNENFKFALNIIARAQGGGDLNNFVSYIPIAQKGHNEFGNENEFGFNLAAWPDFSSLDASGVTYKVYYSTDENPTTDDWRGDAGYIEGAPSAADVPNVTMIKIVTEKIPWGTNAYIIMDLAVDGQKDAGNPSAYMGGLFRYDGHTGGTSTVIKYTLETAKISGKVWMDDDMSGSYASGSDSPVAGHTVELYSETNLTTPVATVTTEADGTYLLETPLAGNYLVKTSLPSEKHSFVAKSTDSIVDPVTGRSDAIPLNATEVTGADIGMYQLTYAYQVKYYKDSVTSENLLGTEAGTTKFARDYQLKAADIASDLDNGSISWLNLHQPSGYQSGVAQNLPFTITLDATSNTILVVYAKDSFQYTVEYYYDNTHDDSKDAVATAVFGSTITTYTDKNIAGYKLAKTEGLPLTIGVDESANVIKVYYEKDTYAYTVKYYLDGTYQTGSDETGSAVFGSEISTYTDKCPGGYKLSSVVNMPMTITENASSNVAHIYYVKDSFGYTIKYYVDGVHQTSWDETGTGIFQSQILAAAVPDKCPSGYKFGNYNNIPLTISANASNNVGEVYYIKDDGSTQDTVYYVNYYVDGTKVESDSYSITSTAWSEADPAMIKITSTIDARDGKYNGYKVDWDASSAIPAVNTEVETGTVIDIYYVKDSFAYTIEYYVDGAHQTGWNESGTAEYASTISTYADKCPEGYKLDRTVDMPLTISHNASSNVAKIYYVKDNFGYTIEYYVDGTHQPAMDVTGTAVFGSQIADYVDKLPQGYKLEKTEGFPITIGADATANVARVYYVKNTFAYTIEYYVAGVHQTSWDETGTGVFQSQILPAAVPDKCPDGYKFDTYSNIPLTITANAGNNVGKVYYVKDDGQTKQTVYTVNYYVDGTKVEADSYSITGTAWKNDDPAMITITSTIASHDGKYAGYKVDWDASSTVPTVGTSVESGTVIDIYYVKDSFGYTIEYYFDNAIDSTLTETGTATYLDVISSYTDNRRDGYKLDTEVNMPMTISYTAASNVAKIYYVKDSFAYTIEYYVDGTKQDWDETGSAVFDSTISTYPDKCPVGYTFGSVSNIPIKIASDASKNVGKVYYVTDTGQTQKTNYTVNYYKNGTLVEADSYTVDGTAWINDDPAMITITAAIDTSENKYTGYKRDSMTPDPVPAVGTKVESGTVISIYYVKDDFAYTIEYYVDGAHKPELDETGTATFEESISTYTDKCPVGYKLEKTTNMPLSITADAGSNVARIYYVKDSFDYTIQYFVDGTYMSAEDVTASAIFASTIDSYPDKRPAGYRLEKTEGFPMIISANAAENVAQVYYVKDSYPYTIEYYVDGTKQDWDETGMAEFKSQITSYPDKCPTGYRFGMVLNIPITISVNASENVGKVYYVRDDGQQKETFYAVNYFVDGVKVEADSYIVKGSAWINDDAPQIKVTGTIASHDYKYPGYVVDWGTSSTVPVVGSDIPSGTEINLYYVKDKFAYTIEYYVDGQKQDWDETGQAEYLSTVSSYLDKCPTGYKLDAEDNMPMNITDTPSKNVARIYYVKDVFAYTIEYYVDGVYQEGWDETGIDLFKNQITSAPDKCPVGYKLGSVTNIPLTITAVPSDNVGKVFYIKDDGQTQDTIYHVNYYADGARIDADSYSVAGTAWINNDPAEIKITAAIDARVNKYAGYKLDAGATSVIPAAGTWVETGTTIDIYYVRDTFGYTIQYFLDGTYQPTWDETGTGLFNDVISTYKNKRPAGYKLDGANNIPLTIGDRASANTAQVYYVRDAFPYTIEYYFNGVYDGNLTEKGTRLFGEKILTNDPASTLAHGGNTFNLKSVTGQGLTIGTSGAKNVVKIYYTYTAPPVVVDTNISITAHDFTLTLAEARAHQDKVPADQFLEMVLRGSASAWMTESKDPVDITLIRVVPVGGGAEGQSIAASPGEYWVTYYAGTGDKAVKITVKVTVLPEPVVTPPATPTNPVPSNPAPQVNIPITVPEVIEQPVIEAVNGVASVAEGTIGTPEVPSSIIGNDITPLAHNEATCWVHWYILLGMIISAVYAAVVIARRRRFTNILRGYEDEVLDDGRARNRQQQRERGYHFPQTTPSAQTAYFTAE